jgi:hypothetical protein
MQHEGQPLFATELSDVWTTAQQRRGEFLALWFAGLRGRARAALSRQELYLRQGRWSFRPSRFEPDRA